MSSEAGTVAIGGAPREAEAGADRVRSLAPSRRVAGLVALCGMGAVSLFLVLAAANRPSQLSPVTHEGFFPGWMAGPLGGLLPGLPNGIVATRIIFTGCLLILIGLYLVVLRGAHDLPGRAVIAAIVFVQTLYTVSPPLATTDIFNYINYARMEAIHDLNPYTTIPISEPHSDPSFLVSNWHQLLSPYGPSFTLVTIALVPLGVAGTMWGLKVLFALASLALVALVWRFAKLLGRDPVVAVVFVALNPIVLIWGIGGGHNDFLMMLAVLGGLYLAVHAEKLAKEREQPPRALWPLDWRLFAAGITFVFAFSLKASAAVVLPVALAYVWPRRRALVQVLLGMGAGVLVFGSATLAVFGPHVPDVSAQSSLVTPESVPNLLGLALGFGGETAGLHTFTFVALAATVAVAAWYAMTRRDVLTPVGWVSIAVLLTLSWVLPWYVLWVLPIAAVAGSRRLKIASLLVGLYLVISPVSVWRAIGVHPESTPLGHQHERQVNELLH